jgi:hypothetical protein
LRWLSRGSQGTGVASQDDSKSARRRRDALHSGPQHPSTPKALARRESIRSFSDLSLGSTGCMAKCPNRSSLHILTSVLLHLSSRTQYPLKLSLLFVYPKTSLP